jgi:hypothetical protein
MPYLNFFNNLQSTSESGEIKELTGDSLIEALNNHLDSRFSLAELKKKYDELYPPVVEAQ